MERKNKLFVQIMLCLALLAAVKGAFLQDIHGFADMQEKIMQTLSRNFTLDEVADAGKKAASTVASVPTRVSSAILEANQLSQYGEPIDEDSADKIKPVYAVAGGTVLKAGVSKDLGMYVEVEHHDRISTYGNLCDLRVCSGDRIKKGDILGSFDATQEKEFYFELEQKA